MTLKELNIDATWTLFLDRDGVINKKRDNDYVKNRDEFIFLNGSLDALKKLSETFGKIIIVTNQRGIGRGLYSEAEYANVTKYMLEAIQKAGGRIDAVFHCPHLGTEPACNCRKPKTGMYQQALVKFPQINPRRSMMVGDSPSDMDFANHAGIFSVQVNYTNKADAHFHFPSLFAFSTALYS
jgi:histidinol-phosphate phosphatase family protein